MHTLFASQKSGKFGSQLFRLLEIGWQCVWGSRPQMSWTRQTGDMGLQACCAEAGRDFRGKRGGEERGLLKLCEELGILRDPWGSCGNRGLGSGWGAWGVVGGS